MDSAGAEGKREGLAGTGAKGGSALPSPRRLGVSRSLRTALTTTRATSAIVLAVGIVVTGAAGMGSARAGTYVMRTCNVPGQANSVLAPWVAFDNATPDASIVDACAIGGGVGFALGNSQQMPGGFGMGMELRKPTGPRSQILFVKAVLWYAARLAGSGQPLYFRVYDYRVDTSSQLGLFNAPPGSEYLVGEQLLSPDTDTINLGIACGPLNGTQNRDPCVLADRIPLLIRGIEVTLSEDILPVVLRPAGTLLDGGPQSGVRDLTYAASDAHSGLSKVDVLLGETVVASRDLTPLCPYADFTVCPASRDETLQIDTRAVPNGSHRVTLRVRDAAGNERLVEDERAVAVANEPAPSRTNVPSGPAPAATNTAAGPSPATSAASRPDPGTTSVANEPAPAMTNVTPCTILANFKGTSGRTLTVSYGRRVSVQGRVVQGLQPMPDVPIQMLERPDRRGAPEKVKSAVMTNADGSFSIELATSRPSRVVRLACRPAGGNQAVSQGLRLRVRAASTLRVSLRGVMVRFSGRVRSGPLPKQGKRVQLEGRSPGSAWTTFKTLRTDRRGGFSGRYRLRVRRPGVALKIRAIVPSEDGYGYVSSRSRAVTLRVR